jgi:PAS domain S-box-containing protein
MSKTNSVPKWPLKRAFSKRWRLYITLVLCSVLPLVLFLYAGDRLLRRLTIKNLLQQSGPAADLAAKVIEERLADARASLESLATDPGIAGAWTQADVPRLVARLQEAHELKRDVAVWAVYDANGFLRASYPKITDQPAENLAASDWFRAAIQRRGVYVSGVSATTTTAHGLFITVAAPLNRQQSAGVIAATYTLDTIKNWLSALPVSTTKWISIVDQNGVMVAAPDLGPSASPRNVSAHENVKKVIAGQGGTEFLWQDGKQVLVSRHPLSSLGWGVLVEIPREEINKAIWKFEQPLALVGLLFLGLALAVGGAGALLYRRLRESKEHIRQIVTTANDAFIAIDERGAITDWNPQAEALFGYSEAEALGQSLHTTIIPQRYREAHLRGLRHFMATGEGPVLNKPLVLAALDRNGREFPVEFSISHVRTRGKSSFNAFVRDISERKRAEEEIAKLNDELHGRISELETRNKELEAFSYSVSHDVRAPIRHIAGFSSLLSKECAQDMTPAGREYLEEVQNAARRMQRLVDDLLRFSKLGEQGLELEMTNLDDVVGEVVSSLRHDLDGRDVIFELSDLPSTECDRGLVKQVFWNLLSNAVKFTATREHAVIAVGECRQDDQNVLFVRDNGVGFNMKYADKLFGAFQRLHTQEEFEGTGVGLATVRRIILKHNGRIWAHAEPNQGASFFFSLKPSEPGTASAAHG